MADRFKARGRTTNGDSARANLLERDDNRRRRREDRDYTVPLAVFLGLAVLAVVVLAIVLPLTLRCTTAGQMCGGVPIRADQLCVDFIIAGGGTAGSAAIKRLTEDRTQQVLVVEAGQDIINDPNIFLSQNLLETLNVPMDYPYAYNFARLLEDQATTGFRQENTLAGRGLGGSALINTLVAITASSDYWDAVDAFVGSPGTFTGDAIYATNAQLEWLETYGHYAAGPDRGTAESATNQYKLASKPVVDDPTDDSHFVANLISTAYGIPNGAGTQSYNNKDISLQANPFLETLEDFNTTLFNRWGPRRAFLNPPVMDQTTFTGLDGRQLQVLLNSTVTRLLFDPSNPTRCIGVRYTNVEGQSVEAFARKSVIVSMYWQSPVLLQQSGIGPATVLQEANIVPRVINENVGRQWRYHPHFEFAFYSPNVTGAAVDPPNTGSFQGSSIAFVNDTSPVGIAGRRAYEYISVTFPEIIAFNVWQLEPLSEGTITTNTATPTQPARMLSNQFTDSDDLLSMREFIRRMVTVFTATDPLLLFLSIDPVTLADDGLLDEWIFDNAVLSTYHHFGMNAMCTSDATGVVDSRFRVFGTTGLRVCDLSVLPIPADGNPSSPAYILGDICGRMTLEDFGSTISARKEHRVHTFESRKRATSEPLHKRKRTAQAKAATVTRKYETHEFESRAASTEEQICTAVRGLAALPPGRFFSTNKDSLLNPIRLNYPQCFKPV